MGNGGNGGGGGGNDGGGGGNGGGGNGGGGKEIALGMPPWGPYNVFIEYARENDLWTQEFEKAGYEVDIQATWEDANLFASGKTQFSMVSTLEAAQMGQQREETMLAFGQQGLAPHGYITKTDGPYDPANTGSIQASLDKLVEQNDRLALGSWAAGSLPYQKAAIKEQFGYNLEEGGDFNVSIVDYGAMPALLRQDEVSVIVNSPLHGAAGGLLNDEFTAIWWDMNLYKEHYDTVPPIGNMIMSQEYFQNNRPAAKAMLRVFKKSVGYIAEHPDEIAQKDYTLDSLPVDNAEQAKMVINWSYNGAGAYTEPAIPPDPEMTQEVQNANKSFMDKAANLGMTLENWDEWMAYDHVSADINATSTPDSS